MATTDKPNKTRYEETGPVRDLEVLQTDGERPKRISGGDGLDKATEKQLEEVRLMTAMMQEHAEAIKRLSKKRRTTILKLREKRVTYRLIAEAMGNATIQAVYKVIRGDL